MLRSIKELRAAGCSLQLISQVDKRLRASFDRGLSNAVLYYDGKDVLVEEQGTVVSLITQAGQALFAETVRFLALPLQTWAHEGVEHAEMVDISQIRERRAALRASRASA